MRVVNVKRVSVAVVKGRVAERIARLLENVSELAADLSVGGLPYGGIFQTRRFPPHASAGANSGNGVAVVGELVVGRQNGIAR